MKHCVFGGQYGSEGKGSVSEYYAKLNLASNGGCTDRNPNKLLIAAGENSPNSGHTCTVGSTRNIPSVSFFADCILLGPDSIIDINCLKADLEAVAKYRGKTIPIYIHQNAGFLDINSDREKDCMDVVERISSTNSGTTVAREQKFTRRAEDATIGKIMAQHDGNLALVLGQPASLLNHMQYLHFLNTNSSYDWIFECSQGSLLDTNWGIYPYVTSRSTLPRVAIARNGLSAFDWHYTGTYRTYPIRTGGPSGPTGGAETTFESIGVPSEQATVTKRIRRIFKFSAEDFYLSIQLNQPDTIAFTHLDYLQPDRQDDFGKEFFKEWLDLVGAWQYIGVTKGQRVIASAKPAEFYQIH